MTQAKLLFNYIAMLLAREPLDFDVKKSVYIKLLNDLKSLEKNHNQILAIQKWIFETEMTEKYFVDDTKKTDNILIYSKEPLISQQIKSMKSQLQNKEAIIESKNKLLNILTNIELNQKLLQRKYSEEIQQAQIKLVEIRNALHLSSNVYSQLQTKNIVNNTKTDKLRELMKSVEIHLENRVTGIELNAKKLNESIAEISKEMIMGFPLNAVKNECIIREQNNNLLASKCNLLNSYTEQTNIINNYINKTDELKPSEMLSKNENLYNINWTDFLMTYNLANENFTLDIYQKYNSATTVNTLLDKLNDTEQTLNSKIKDILLIIDDVQFKRNANITILNKMNEDLDKLKQNYGSMAIFYRKCNDLKVQCTNSISDLENNIHMSNTRLSAAIQNNKNLQFDFQRSDMLFKTNYQKYIFLLNNSCQTLLLNDKKLNKGIFLPENLSKLKNRHNQLLQEQTKIILDHFNKEKMTLETIIQKKSGNFIEKRNIIITYKNKQNTYKQLAVQLKDLKTYTEYFNKGLLKVYRDLMFCNHGKTLKQLEEEEIEFQRSVNLYNKELHDLNNEIGIIENHSKHMSIKSQIKICNETLQQITTANESLKIEINKKNNSRSIDFINFKI